MTASPPPDVDPAARAVIRRKVNALCRQSRWFAPGDRGDVEQELALHAHRITPKFDPSRGTPLAFFERALGNRLKDLRAEARAGRRDWRRSVAIAEPDTVEAVRGDEELRFDVRDALRALPEPLRRLAGALADDTLLGASRTLGLSRQQARRQRQLLARHLARCGLHPGERRAA